MNETLKKAGPQSAVVVELLMVSRSSRRFWADCLLVSDEVAGSPGVFRATIVERLQMNIDELGCRAEERTANEINLLVASELVLERIGRDLHDSLGQQITGLSMLHSSLVHRLTEKHAPEAQIAEEEAAVLKRARAELRRICRGVQRVGGEDGALLSRIQDFVREVEEFHAITCALECNEPIKLSPDASTQLFRILQDFVAQSVTRRAATEVMIALIRANGDTVLEIKDNGFSEHTQSPDRDEMPMITCRAEALRWELQLEVADPKGMVFRCRVPGTVRT
jgi:signal transduction histidine kinase